MAQTAKADTEDEDLWNLVILESEGKSWGEKSLRERVISVLLTLLKICVLLTLLYLFICSLDLLSSSFKLLGGKAASGAFGNSEILNNPIANLMIGVLATVLLQSSSTTTSIVVAMVASSLLPVRPAIFIIMGSNIGTSVTNTLVSVGQAIDRAQFRRAFAGATVHDMFNWLTVIILLPLEWISGSIGSWKNCGLLCQLTAVMTEQLRVLETSEGSESEMLQVITKPLTNLIIQMDKDILVQLAQQGANDTEDVSERSLIKHWCKEQARLPEAYLNPANNTCQLRYIDIQVQVRCIHLMEHISNTWSDTAVGACLLIISLALLIFCLVSMVKVLNSMLQGAVAQIIQKVLNSDFPRPFGFLTGYAAMLVGVGMTMILQSSSIFTSALTPLVGAGVLHLDRMFPLTLGSNIGTTFTAVLAALSASRDIFQITMQVALCHLFFNVLGIVIWYPVPYMRRVPISLAKKLGHTTANHRWFAIVYIAFMFFLAPAGIFGLSILGWAVLLAVIGPIAMLFVVIGVISMMQSRRPSALPSVLRTWKFLPVWLRSLDPYDKWMEHIPTCKNRVRCCSSHDQDEEITQNGIAKNDGEDRRSTETAVQLTSL